MKTRNQFEATRRVAGLIAIAIIATAIIGCKNDEPTDKPNPITREFTITGFAKPITVKDMRTGENDTDLETLGIISYITVGLTKVSNTNDEFDRGNFNTIIGRNLVIVVEEPAGAYQRTYSYSGNRMGCNFSYISTNPDDLVSKMFVAFENMAGKEPDGQ